MTDQGSTFRRMPRSGDEQDVFTRWRKFYKWTQRAGATARVKRGARRRERHDAKQAIRRKNYYSHE